MLEHLLLFNGYSKFAGKHVFFERVIAMNTVSEIKKLIQPLADEMGYDIVDLQYVKEGKHWFLRIYIDQLGGVDINDCSCFSEAVSEQLDQADPDPIPYAYYLEVSSPGAERPLKTEKDFENAVGRYIFVTLYDAVDKKNTYEGTLVALTSDSATIEFKDKQRKKQIVLARDNISKARLAVEF